MKGAQLFTFVATPVEVPALVERTRWPVHVTIAGNFRVDAVHTLQVSTLLASVVSDIAAFDVVLGPRARFRPEQNVAVLLARHLTFHRPHE